MKARAHIYLRGRVQGVFFRASIVREAKVRNITGWVRNISDDKVEAIFEGEREMVEQILDFCRMGPPKAVINKMDVSWEEVSEDCSNFKVKKNRD